MKKVFLAAVVAASIVSAQDFRSVPKHEILPDAAPRAHDGTGWFAAADFLYWSAHEDQLDFARSNGGGSVPEGSILTTPEGRIYSLGWSWSPGFKLGAGYVFAHDGWDLCAEYTWYKTKSVGTTPFFSDPNFNPNPNLTDKFWNISNQGNVSLFSATAAWRLRLDVFDLLLGRRFFVSPWLKLKPSFGLKGMLARQSMKVRNSPFSLIGKRATTRNRMQQEGLGICASVDSAWQFTEQWSLAGGATLSALWEHFESRRFDVNPQDPSVVSGIHVSNDFHDIQPVIEWMLGLRWETGPSPRRVHMAVEAGWEQQVWFSQNRFVHVSPRKISPASYPGDLILQGFTAKARADF